MAITPPIIDPPGTGTGVNPVLSSGLVRLSKMMSGTGSNDWTWAGEGDARRPVMLTTRCNTLAVSTVRMAKRAPGTGSSGWEYAGTGTARRQVWLYGECTEAPGPGTGTGPRDLGPYVPPGYDPIGGDGFVCCDGVYQPFGVAYPSMLSVYFARVWPPGSPGYCLDLDDLAVTVFHRYPPAGGQPGAYSNSLWVTLNHPFWVIGPGLVPVFGGYTRETVRLDILLRYQCVDNPSPTQDQVAWVLAVAVYPSAAVGYGTILRIAPTPVGGLTALKDCNRPFPLVFGGGNGSDMQHQKGVLQRGISSFYSYDPCNINTGVSFNDEYRITVVSPIPFGASPGTGTNFDPNLGTGTGTHNTHRGYRGATSLATAGLSKYLRMSIAGRPIYGQACCSGTGTGSPGCPTFVVPCCPGGVGVNVPCALALHLFTDVTGSGCCLEDVTVPFTRTGNNFYWSAQVTCPGGTVNVNMYCDEVEWVISLSNPAGGCATEIRVPRESVSCSPFDLGGTFSLTGSAASCFGFTGCGGLDVHAHVTEA